VALGFLPRVARKVTRGVFSFSPGLANGYTVIEMYSQS
jgi:hypothetical protein